MCACSIFLSTLSKAECALALSTAVFSNVLPSKRLSKKVVASSTALSSVTLPEIESTVLHATYFSA